MSSLLIVASHTLCYCYTLLLALYSTIRHGCCSLCLHESPRKPLKLNILNGCPTSPQHSPGVAFSVPNDHHHKSRHPPLQTLANLPEMRYVSSTEHPPAPSLFSHVIASKPFNFHRPSSVCINFTGKTNRELTLQPLAACLPSTSASPPTLNLSITAACRPAMTHHHHSSPLSTNKKPSAAHLHVSKYLTDFALLAHHSPAHKK